MTDMAEIVIQIKTVTVTATSLIKMYSLSKPTFSCIKISKMIFDGWISTLIETSYMILFYLVTN